MVEPEWMRETWAEWAAAVVLVTFRVVLRTMNLGFKGWQGDDYLILIAIASYTISAISCEVMYRNGTNQGLTQGMVDNMKPHEIRARVVGAKWDFAGWVTYATLIWACKGCMLYLYSRLTFGLWQRKLVKLSAYLCILTYIAAWLGMLLKCIPIKRNFQVKPLPGTCVNGLVNLYTMGITNFLTDCLILAIPVPLILKITLPTKKKVFIGVMLCSGIFVMAATLLRVIITLLVEYGKLNGMGYDLGFMLGWSNRENFVAVVIVNIPIIFSSVKRVRTKQRSRSRSKVSYGASSTSGRSDVRELRKDKADIDTFVELETRKTQDEKDASLKDFSLNSGAITQNDSIGLKIEKSTGMMITSEDNLVKGVGEDLGKGERGQDSAVRGRSGSFLDFS